MKPMSYEQTCNTYYDIVLDIARNDSRYIFDVISTFMFDNIDDSIKDMYDGWIAERRSIVEELRECV